MDDSYTTNINERQPLSIDNGDSVDDDNNDNNNNINNDVTTSVTGSRQKQQKQIITQQQEKIISIIESISDRTIRPGRIAGELGISIDDASKELCTILAAVGSGATFHFENSSTTSSSTTSNTNTTIVKQKAIITMVFTFPKENTINIRNCVQKYYRKQNRYDYYIEIWYIIIKIIKIITAFGLLLSLFIISIIVLISLIAALIAAARIGCLNTNPRYQNSIVHQIRYIFISFKQLLWCYALFGTPTSFTNDNNTTNANNNQDPFLREAAYDLWLFLSVCCGNPSNIFFWYNANLLSHRRRQQHNRYQTIFNYFRYSSSTSSSTSTNNNSYNSSTARNPNEMLPGVFIVPRDPGIYDTTTNAPNNTSSLASSLPLTGTTGTAGSTCTGEQQQHRGLLSIAVEFLFGPSSVEQPGPTKEIISRLRAAAILQKLISNKNNNNNDQQQQCGITLFDLAPYIDFPPHINIVSSASASTSTSSSSSNDDNTVITLPNESILNEKALTAITSQGLLIVSFFNGIPLLSDDTANAIVTSSGATTSTPAITSPQYMATIAKFTFPELLAESTVITQYDYQSEYDDMTWNSFLYKRNTNDETATTTTTTTTTVPNSTRSTSTTILADGRIVRGNGRRATSTSSLSTTTTEIHTFSKTSTMQQLPQYLIEERYKFTKLSKQQLLYCIVLGILNIIGVYGSYQSISYNGIIDVTRIPLLNLLLRKTLYPILKFYSLFYFTIPFCRLCILYILNKQRQYRNEQRYKLSKIQFSELK